MNAHTEELERKLAEHERMAEHWKNKSFPVFDYHFGEAKKLRALLGKPLPPTTEGAGK